MRHCMPREVVDKPTSVVQHNLFELLARGDGEAVHEDGDAREHAAGCRGGDGRVRIELRGKLAVLRGHVAPEVGEWGGGEGAARVFGGGGIGVGFRRRSRVVAPRPLLTGRGGHRRRRWRGAAAGGAGAHCGGSHGRGEMGGARGEEVGSGRLEIGRAHV